MRRTYRSKKDAGDALDHKDVLLTMDEKSSAFDAFYIQNIKQTKREMSSVNFLAAPPSKVRKRKYVKRILKDPEPQKETTLLDDRDSVYLTPNKSIHVNKPLDPFDQLLNSPSTHRNGSLKVNKAVFGYQKTAKTYRKKKVTKVRKYNYSSSDSTESDKENSDNSKTPDKSNVKKHKLFIEKQFKTSPMCLDKSINDLVKNFSLLKKTSPKTPVKLTKPFYFSNNRLTTNMQSQILQNSPLCSTPFKEKYRGASIYKFSPIGTKVFTEDEDIDTSLNNSNDSIIFVGKEKRILPIKVERNLSTEACKSPVFKTPDNFKAISASMEDCGNLSNINGNSVCERTPQYSLEKNSAEGNKTDLILQEHTVLHKECEKSDIKVASSIEISSLQTTEIEPFLGFSNKCPVLIEVQNSMSSSQHEFDDSVSPQKPVLNTELVTEKAGTSDESIDDIASTSETLDNRRDSNRSQYNYSMENSIMLFSNDNPIENEVNEECGSGNPHDEKIFCNSEPFEAENDIDSQNEKCNDSHLSSNKSVDSNNDMISEPLGAHKDIDSQNEECNVSELSSNKSLDNDNDSQTQNVKDHNSFTNDETVNTDNECEGSEDKSSSSQDSDNQSLYDTCDSGATSQDESNICFSKIPIVELDRLNDSVFQKYYNKLSEYDEQQDSDSCQDSDNYESVESISNVTNQSEEDSCNSEIDENNSNLDTPPDCSDDNDSNSNTDDDRCISFVTTRRRNEVTNDSMILAFNDSYGSVSSLECDKTVLSNNRSSNRKSDIDATLVKADSLIETLPAEVEKPDETRVSNVVTRRTHGSKLAFEDNNDCDEPKPMIVLQPGKKWERSLSIYRRMTMANDNLDYSLLEDDQMQTKGRKYRQSIISTMEMQDQSILHNESLNSRRSTFVSKPCRSTIKIVKEPNTSRTSLCASAVFDDLQGFLNEDCDDTIVELSKLSIADSEHEVTVLETFHDGVGRVATARDYVLRRCNQTEILLFDECYPDTVLKNCHKIGEGVYGEVFLWRARDGRARVMKIVPIAGSVKVNGESQKDFQEIISEIVIAMELSALRAPIADIERHFDEGNDIDALDLHSVENATDVFNEVLTVKCVNGSYPSRLLDLWELYDECKGSENDNPAILPVDQQYIVLELANAGLDLESYQFNSAEQAHALFFQVAFALAVGEESFQFEHRDLHWGNVLITPTDQKFATFVLRGRLYRVLRRGVAGTVIDYSLSRLSLPLRSDRAALYNDLSADDGLFDARGDYQFDVYRHMRDKLGNDWKNFEPHTNILWLHYTVDKMITALRYKRTNTKIHKHYIAKLKGIKNRILDYGSATQFVLTDNEY